MITPDAQAMMLLCSHLGLPQDPDASPLTLREWNPLARKLLAAEMRPGELLDKTAAELSAGLDLKEEEAGRLSQLLGRSGALAIELERLASLGIYPLTRADRDYPDRYRQRLKDAAPAVLFFAGERALLGQPGIAVVGSRNLDEAGVACAEFVGNACAHAGLVLYSGGARGVDTLAMEACLQARGTAVGILAHGLEKTIRLPEYRAALSRGDLCLATPYSPGAGFSVGAAMGRNRLIYTLADYAIVVASEAGKGGTWSGASETLKHGWVPVFALEHEAMPDGNRELIENGAVPFPHPFPEHFSTLPDWLETHRTRTAPKPRQLGLL